jgi:hypothetical protein
LRTTYRQRGDPGAEVDRRDALLGEPPDPLRLRGPKTSPRSVAVDDMTADGKESIV